MRRCDRVSWEGERGSEAAGTMQAWSEAQGSEGLEVRGQQCGVAPKGIGSARTPASLTLLGFTPALPNGWDGSSCVVVSGGDYVRLRVLPQSGVQSRLAQAATALPHLLVSWACCLVCTTKQDAAAFSCPHHPQPAGCHNLPGCVFLALRPCNADYRTFSVVQCLWLPCVL